MCDHVLNFGPKRFESQPADVAVVWGSYSPSCDAQGGPAWEDKTLFWPSASYKRGRHRRLPSGFVRAINSRPGWRFPRLICPNDEAHSIRGRTYSLG
jgi:hypothetical protein